MTSWLLLLVQQQLEEILPHQHLSCGGWKGQRPATAKQGCWCFFILWRNEGYSRERRGNKSQWLLISSASKLGESEEEPGTVWIFYLLHVEDDLHHPLIYYITFIKAGNVNWPRWDGEWSWRRSSGLFRLDNHLAERQCSLPPPSTSSALSVCSLSVHMVVVTLSSSHDQDDRLLVVAAVVNCGEEEALNLASNNEMFE